MDKSGHPIVHFKVLETPPSDPWTMVRAAVFAVEKCIKMAARRGVFQMLWMVDLEHLSYSTMPPVEVLLEVSSLMTYYYPERLHRAYMLFTPWIFSAIFKAMTPCLPLRTQSKIAIPGWYQSERAETFRDDIDAAQLVSRYGGENETQYDYQWELGQFSRRRPAAAEQESEEKQLGNGAVGDEVVEEEHKEQEQAAADEEDDGDVAAESEEDDDGKICIVCLDGERDHVLIPCGHLCLCGDCAASYGADDAECPLCRKTVEMVVKTFS